MFNPRKSKFPFILACLAALCFVFFSLGGEFLHTYLHHHENGSEQECPLYQILVQAAVSFIAVVAAFKFRHSYQKLNPSPIILSEAAYPSASPRAPPAVS